MYANYTNASVSRTILQPTWPLGWGRNCTFPLADISLSKLYLLDSPHLALGDGGFLLPSPGGQRTNMGLLTEPQPSA